MVTESNKSVRAIILLLPIFGLLAAAITIEIVFRLFSTTKIAARWSDRPKYYYRSHKSTSLQGNVYDAVKPKDTFRVAVVGDSISFGPHMQFDDTFPAKLGRMLNLDASTKKAEVINYGVPGYSTFRELNTVKAAINEGADLVILQITLNDPEIEPLNLKHEESAKRFGKFTPTPFEGALFKYWSSLGYLVERVHNMRSREAYRDYFFDLFKNPRTYGQFEDSIKKISAMTAANNIKLVAVVFPLFGFQLDESYPFEPIHKQIADLLGSINVPALDLYPTFKGIPLERLHVIPWQDLHGNEIAHRLAAESIFQWLYNIHEIPKEFEVPLLYVQRNGLQDAHFKEFLNPPTDR